MAKEKLWTELILNSGDGLLWLSGVGVYYVGAYSGGVWGCGAVCLCQCARFGFGFAGGRWCCRRLVFGKPESYNVITYLWGNLLVNGELWACHFCFFICGKSV